MRKFTFFLLAMTVLFIASPLYAQAGGGTAPTCNWAIPSGAGIGMGIASGLCGIGQGRATACAAEALARNPWARAGVQLLLLLGSALIESFALGTRVLILDKT